MKDKDKNKKKRTRMIVALICILIAEAAVFGVLAVKKDSIGEVFSGKSNGPEETQEDENKSGEDFGNDEESSDSGTGQNSGQSSGLDTGLEMPFTVADTGLVIDYINSYSGTFIEDGSDEAVENILALHIQNTSAENIEYSMIQLKTADETYCFEITDIPAGASVSVLEKDRKEYEGGILEYVDHQTAYMDSFDLLSDEIGIVVTEDNGLSVTNISERNIPCVRLFYKFMSEENEFIGGITYTAKLENLEAGKTITIYPSHFSKDGSKIMMVRKYDTAE